MADQIPSLGVTVEGNPTPLIQALGGAAEATRGFASEAARAMERTQVAIGGVNFSVVTRKANTETLKLIQLSDQLDVARARGDATTTRALENEITLLRKVQEYRRAGLAPAQAQSAAGAHFDAVKAASGAEKDAIPGLNRVQVLELTHVTKSLFDEIAAGRSPLQALTVEGGRIAQVFAEGQGGVGGTFKALGALFTPLRVGLGLVATAFVALFAVEQGAEKSQSQLANALRGIGGASGETVADLDRIAAATSRAGEGSVSFAKQAEAAFLRVGVGHENLADAVGVVQSFAAVSGTDAPKALAALADAFKDPTAGAKSLGEGILNLSDEQIRHIATLDEQGRHTEALSALIKDIRGAVDGAKPHLTELGQFFADLTGAISGTIAKLGEFLVALVQVPAATKLVQLQGQRAELVASQKTGQTTQYLPDGTTMQTSVPTGGNDARIAALDKQIAALKGEIAKAPDSPQSQRAAVDAKRSREQGALVADLNPDDRTLSRLKTERAQAQNLLDKGGLAPGGPDRNAVAAAVKRANERIKEIEDRGQKKPRREAASTTDSTDATTTGVLDSATKELATARREAAAETRKDSTANTIAGRLALAQANAAGELAAKSAAIDADLKEKLDRIGGEEVKVRGAKNDAHKAEQLAALASARAADIDAAGVRKSTAAREAQDVAEKAARAAQIAAVERDAASRQAAAQNRLELDQLAGADAKGSTEQRAAQLKVLGDQKSLADDGIKATFDKQAAAVTPGPDAAQARADIATNRAAAQSQSDAVFAARGNAVLRNTASPLTQWRDEATLTASQVHDAIETSAVRSLDDFNAGLADAAVNGKSLGDVLHGVFGALEADLIRYLAKQAEIGLFGAGGGAAAGGGLLAPVVGAFASFAGLPGHATGADSFGGATKIDEDGPEGVAFLPKNTQIIPNDTLRGLAQLDPKSLGRGSAPVNLNVSVDAGGAFSFEHVRDAVTQGAQVALAGANLNTARVIAGQARAARSDLTRA